MTNLEKILERFDKLMDGKVIGTLIDGEKGKVFVDGDHELEVPRVKNFIKREFTSAFKELVDLMEGEKKEEDFTKIDTFDYTHAKIAEADKNRLVNRGISKAITILESWMKS